MTCVVEGCNSHSGRKKDSAPGLSFHKFPKDETVIGEWVRRIGRENYTPKSWHKLCSKHFHPDSFLPNQEGRRHLKSNAVPMFIDPQTDLHYGTSNLSENTNSPLTESGPQSVFQFRRAAEKTCGPDNLNLHLIKKEPQSVGCQLTDPLGHSDVPVPCKCSNTRACELSTNDNGVLKLYQKKVKCLEKKLEMVKKVSKRRLVRINTLTKRVSRITKRHDDLYTILVAKLKQENLENFEIEYIEC